MYEVFQASETLDDYAAGLVELKSAPGMSWISGAVFGLNYALGILEDGKDSIYNPDRELWQAYLQDNDAEDTSTSDKAATTTHIVVVIAFADAAGAAGGAVGGAPTGVGALAAAFVVGPHLQRL